MEQPAKNERSEAPVKKSRLILILIPLVLMGIFAVVGIGFMGPQLSTSLQAAQDDLSFVKSEYGAQDVSWERNSMMSVTINGQKVECGQPSAANREAHAPIKCSNGVVLQSNLASNR